MMHKNDNKNSEYEAFLNQNETNQLYDENSLINRTGLEFTRVNLDNTKLHQSK